MIANNIIFDLDGTLIDSRNEIASTYLHVFDRIKPAYQVDPQKLNFGATLQQVLKDVYGENPKVVEQAKILFSSIYDVSAYDETSIFEGVISTLEALKNEGYILHIATNKRYQPTLRILEKKQLKKFFSQIVANEMTPSITLSKLQMIELIMARESFSRGFMVGDSGTDIQAGNDAGLQAIAVTYGYEPADKLMNKNPSAILDSFSKLYTFVKEHSYSNHK